MIKYLLILPIVFLISATAISREFTLSDSVIELGDVMSKRILVGTQGTVIPEKYFLVLDSVADFMVIHDDFGFEIGYHSGRYRIDEKENISYSSACASTIIKYIASQGVSRNRLRIMPFGNSYPIIPYDIIDSLPQDQRLEAHRKNVRVDFKVVCNAKPEFSVNPKKRYRGEVLKVGDILEIDYHFGENIDDEFVTNRLPAKEDEIPMLCEWLRTNPSAKIEIAVHNDESGNDAYNQERSQKKALKIASSFRQQRVKSEAIVPIGYGRSNQIIKEEEILIMCLPGDQSRARRINTRIEIKILHV